MGCLYAHHWECRQDRQRRAEILDQSRLDDRLLAAVQRVGDRARKVTNRREVAHESPESARR